jgi:hypothetical protein
MFQRRKDTNRHSLRFCMRPPLFGCHLHPSAALLSQCTGKIVKFDVGKFHLANPSVAIPPTLIWCHAHRHLSLPQSSSASRFTAGEFGFFIFSQSRDRPDR